MGFNLGPVSGAFEVVSVVYFLFGSVEHDEDIKRHTNKIRKLSFITAPHDTKNHREQQVRAVRDTTDAVQAVKEQLFGLSIQCCD